MDSSARPPERLGETERSLEYQQRVKDVQDDGKKAQLSFDMLKNGQLDEASMYTAREHMFKGYLVLGGNPRSLVRRGTGARLAALKQETSGQPLSDKAEAFRAAHERAAEADVENPDDLLAAMEDVLVMLEPYNTSVGANAFLDRQDTGGELA